jgi:hypothetical protein
LLTRCYKVMAFHTGHSSQLFHDAYHGNARGIPKHGVT